MDPITTCNVFNGTFYECQCFKDSLIILFVGITLSYVIMNIFKRLLFGKDALKDSNQPKKTYILNNGKDPTS